MTFAEPFALLLVLPLALVTGLIWRRADLFAVALPGQWSRVVSPSLRGFLARRMPERRRGQIALCLAIAALLFAAVARPALEVEDAPAYGNLSGRVLVLDLGTAGDVRDQQLFAKTLIEETPGLPTALVATAADAFDVVPLTTDRRQLLRYLAALDPAVMPQAGRTLHRGLAQGEAILKKAGIVAGQIVLVTDGQPPEKSEPLTPSKALRTVVLTSPRSPAWQDFAKTLDARLRAPSEVEGIGQDLADAIDYQKRTRRTDGQFDLTPWVIGLALVLWLGLFRRRAAA